MTGGVFEEAAVYVLPDIVDDSGTYATVGMAAVFAAASRAPITSTLILVEMTDDFGLMVPLLISITAATVVSQLLSRGTIYSVKAERLGVAIEEDVEPSDVMAQLRVSDAMSPVGAPDVDAIRIGDETARIVDGCLRLADGRLAGSLLDMGEAVRNCVVHAGIPLDDALAMAAAWPADFLGLAESHGRIAPGLRADLVWLDDDLRVRATWSGGTRCKSAEGR